MKKKIVIGKEDALIIVDGQNEFVAAWGALCVKGVPGESDNESILINIVNGGLIFKPFGHKVLTKDGHREDHIEHQIFGVKHCIFDTLGQKFVARIAFFEQKKWVDEIIEKGEHSAVISYSVATSPQFPGHIAIMRKKGIKRVFVVGWAYTHCVGWSAIAYATQGFESYIIRDLTRSVPPPLGNPNAMKKLLASPLCGVKEIFLRNIE